MAKGYLYDNGYELISREEALPDTSEASEGDILSLNSEKEPEWSTPESGLPDTTSASAGDVLSLDEDKEPIWKTPKEGISIEGFLVWSIDSENVKFKICKTYGDTSSTNAYTAEELYQLKGARDYIAVLDNSQKCVICIAVSYLSSQYNIIIGRQNVWYHSGSTHQLIGVGVTGNGASTNNIASDKLFSVTDYNRYTMTPVT